MTNEPIYQAFRDIALTLISEKRKHYSADGILHVVRYNTRIHGEGTQFKVNNNLSSEFSRRFMQEYPRYADFFHRRKSKHDVRFDEKGQRVFI